VRNVRLHEDDFLLDHLKNGFNGFYFTHGLPFDCDFHERLDELSRSADSVQMSVISRVPPKIDGVVGLRDSDGNAFEVYDAREGSFYLVRPDGHICGRWRDFDVDTVKQSLKTARGASL